MMEKAPGVQLYKVWSEIAGDARASIIGQIVKFENELAAIQFPACGHLYPRNYANETIEVIPLDTKLDQTTEYCIGPSCDRMFLPLPGMTASDYDGTRGPCKYFTLSRITNTRMATEVADRPTRVLAFFVWCCAC